MKKHLLLVAITAILFCTSTAFSQKAETPKIATEQMETNALEYLEGILNKDITKIFKYINPSVVKKVGGKKKMRERLQTEFMTLEDEKLLIDSLGIIESSIKSSKSTVAIEVIIKTPDGTMVFNGWLRGKLEKGKWYFLNHEDELLITSLGIKEFNEEEPT